MIEEREPQDVAVPHVNQIAIFINQLGQVTICVEDGRGDEDGICFPVEHIQAVIDGLNRVAEEVKCLPE